MLKFIVLCVLLRLGLCVVSAGLEITSRVYSGSTDTRILNFPTHVPPKVNDTGVHTEPKVNYYFNITMIFNTNGPLFGTTASTPASKTASTPASTTASTTTSKTASEKVPTTYPGLISPRPGYVVTNGIGAHKLHTEKLSWRDARQICINEGGDLVVVKSYEEEMLVQKLLQHPENYHAWIGYHNQCGQGLWVSVNNETLSKTGWQHWWSDTMDRNSGSQCARYYLAAVGGIGALNCDETEPFICKITTI